MAKFEWSETFSSLEGEGPYAGRSTVYFRTTKCNFKCAGFNNPSCKDTTTIETIGFDPKNYTSLNDLPPIKHGCDSIYSWDNKFSHLWHSGTEDDVAKAIIDLLPNRSFIYPNGKDIILSITGGEPTLRAKALPAVFNHPLLKDCKHILIETNCAVPLTHKFIGDINEWLSANSERKWTWSNSPKLSASGESWSQAINPSIAKMQLLATGREGCNQMDQYFKFVCNGSDQSFEEVEKAMSEYYAAGIPTNVDVYIMPEACQQEDQQEVACDVAKQCIRRGYIYCHRVHLDVFGNTPGT